MRIPWLMALAALLAGCSVTMDTAYDPATMEHLSGFLDVKEFNYSPGKNIAHNEIEGLFGTGALLSEDVEEYFTDAARKELERAGVTLGKYSCVLEGDISKLNLFEIYSIAHFARYFVNYTLEVDYVLRDERKAAIVYKKIDSFTRGLSIDRENINHVVARNINSLLRDREFVSALNTYCAR